MVKKAFELWAIQWALGSGGLIQLTLAAAANRQATAAWRWLVALWSTTADRLSSTGSYQHLFAKEQTRRNLGEHCPMEKVPVGQYIEVDSGVASLRVACRGLLMVLCMGRTRTEEPP
jgi:hypothetical protein